MRNTDEAHPQQEEKQRLKRWRTQEARLAKPL